MRKQTPVILGRLRFMLGGDGLRARALRGTAFTFFGFGAQMFLRLLSNLILTRLLFPEAFGLMALVMVFMTGLEMFTDTGIQTSIVQNRRGAEPTFLNTAWTMQIVRGTFLLLMTFALALPLAEFYGQPELTALLPVAGLNVMIQSFQSMRLFLANRNLVVGRLTVLELVGQASGIVVMVLLAWLMESVWALMIGALVGSTTKVILTHLALPGPRDLFGWEHAAFGELFHFGKYIFISSIAGFLVNNADRAVLGKFVTIAELGIYNIGFFMASVPLMICFQMGGRVMLPIYTKTSPQESKANLRKIRLARGLLTAGLFAIGLSFALIGDWLISVLYEAEYALAGPIMVLLSLTYLPTIVLNPYGDLLLAAGKPKNFTIQKITLGVFQLVLLILLVKDYGILGAIITPGLAVLMVYPLTAWFAHRARGWDPVLDLFFLIIILLGATGVLRLHDTAIAEVLQGLSG